MDDTEKALAIAVIIIVLILAYNVFATREMMAYNGSMYPVYVNHTDHKEALAIIAYLDSQLMTLIQHIKYRYPNDPVVINILKRYNPDNIGEERPHNFMGHTSYTINKGEAFRYCLRDKTTLKLHKKDDLTFVAIHELAHVGDWNFNHGPTFWSVFKFLLIEAKAIGLHYPVDYAAQPIMYCGMNVMYNPYFDVSLQAYNPLI